MSGALFGFGECAGPASGLATQLELPFHEVDVHRFPDGESLVTVPESPPCAILYRSLDDPNAKLVELLLAASALRDNGARRVVLVAPYLAYMRQDTAFHPGEAVSQQVIGKLLATHFDVLVTVDPHLHRITRLEEAFPGITCANVSAAPVLATALARIDQPVLVGPDSESRQWLEAIAHPQGLDILLGEKQRSGDRKVEISIPGITRTAGRHAVLIDDVISSGATLIAAAQLLARAGASRIDVLATHCLADANDLASIKAAGISSIRATATVPGPVASLPIAPLLAEAIRAGGLLT